MLESKEQRDGHIRRYAESLETRKARPQQDAAVLPKRGAGQPVGAPRQIAEKTGLSVDTVRRANQDVCFLIYVSAGYVLAFHF